MSCRVTLIFENTFGMIAVEQIKGSSKHNWTEAIPSEIFKL